MDAVFTAEFSMLSLFVINLPLQSPLHWGASSTVYSIPVAVSFFPWQVNFRHMRQLCRDNRFLFNTASKEFNTHFLAKTYASELKKTGILLGPSRAQNVAYASVWWHRIGSLHVPSPHLEYFPRSTQHWWHFQNKIFYTTSGSVLHLNHVSVKRKYKFQFEHFINATHANMQLMPTVRLQGNKTKKKEEKKKVSLLPLPSSSNFYHEVQLPQPTPIHIFGQSLPKVSRQCSPSDSAV